MMDVSVFEERRKLKRQWKQRPRTSIGGDEDEVPLTGEKLRSVLFQPRRAVKKKPRQSHTLPEIRSIQGIRDRAGKWTTTEDMPKSKRKGPTFSEKKNASTAMETMTLRQNGGMFPEHWTRQKDNARRQREVSLSDQQAYTGVLGHPRGSLKSISEMLPYMKLSTKSFTMGLNIQVQHGYALKLRLLNDGCGGLPGMAKEVSEYSELNDCDNRSA